MVPRDACKWFHQSRGAAMLAGQERGPDRTNAASRRHVVNHTHEQALPRAMKTRSARDAEDASSHHDVHRRRDRRQPVRRLGQHRALGGPAAVLAYLAGGIVVVFIMRMLGEMATANPDTGSFSTLCRPGHRPLGGLHHRLAVLGLPGAADGLGGARRGHHPARVVPRCCRSTRVHAGRHAGADPAELSTSGTTARPSSGSR